VTVDVSAATRNALSSLLNEALELEPSARASWLEAMTATRPDLESALRRFLSASEETAEVLTHSTTLPPHESRHGLVDEGSLSSGDEVGPYRLLDPLGVGGMSDVWLAERTDGTVTRKVALKLPRQGIRRRDLAARFARERDILARLEHPNIARLYDAGVSIDGMPYLAMEYVAGKPITVHCDALRLDLPARLRLFTQVLEAVQYAHAHLVIHRDLKPSNILVTGDGQVRLLDFGIAKLLMADHTAHETQLTQLAGRALTPGYASPEQILGRPLTTASDIYSLGVVLYELLAGRRPYRLKQSSAAQLEEAIVSADPTRPSTEINATAAAARGTNARRLGRLLAGDLDTIVMKTLAKAPQDRYGTIAEFSDDLGRYRAGQPVRAQPASFWYRTGKFVARNRLAVGAVAGILVALAVGTALALWQAREARRQAASTAAVKDFLIELFDANSLEQEDSARRRQLTAGQLLEAGATRIGTHFNDQPDLKLELQGLVGRLLHDVALTDQALAMRTERVTALTQRGALPAERARARRDLADTLAQKGDLAGARKELEGAIALLQTQGSRTDAVLRWSLVSTLGYLNLEGDDRGRAEAQLVQAVDELRRLGPQSVEYAEALLRLAESHSAANRIEQSVPMFGEALDLLERALGPRSIQLARFRYQTAAAFQSQRRNKEAEAQLRAALQTMLDTAGPSHPGTAVVQMDLGRLLSIQGRSIEARGLLESAAKTLQAHTGDVDPQHAADALLYLGEALLDDGRVAEAGEPLQQALKRYEATSSVSALTVAWTTYARYLLDTGRYDEAESLLVKTRDRRIALMGRDHPAVASLTNRIGLVHLAAGRLDQAEATFRAVLDSQPNREDVFGSPRHLAALNLAQLDLERQRFDAALPVIDQGLRLYDALPAGDRNRTSELALRLRLARAMLGLGRATDAAPGVQRAEELSADLFEHAPVRIQVHAVKARLLAARGDVAGARAELGLAQASLRAQPQLGPHFERALRAAERDVDRVLANRR
jgi:eukaryotic-like serine/threonine-protein kinase